MRKLYIISVLFRGSRSGLAARGKDAELGALTDIFTSTRPVAHLRERFETHSVVSYDHPVNYARSSIEEDPTRI